MAFVCCLMVCSVLERTAAISLFVSEGLEGVKELLVLGIGRAPKEFTEYFLHDTRHRDVLVTTEKAEDMSEQQLQKAAREHFGHAAPRIWPNLPGQPAPL